MSDIDWSKFNNEMLRHVRNNLARPYDAKPCLICGFKPSLLKHENLTTHEFFYSVEHGRHRCSACDIKIRYCDSLEEAIHKWNILMKDD